ncbi:MAG: type I glyceraldehyde-3-phosphate dehydrogenase [Deltaproteobacteria bacterium]|nr:type I glyceraldehyde-3-phosphate dehydrogenase [Deltaproteobacteria bacterium]
MPVRIGMNGFGRIGRYMARILAGSKTAELVVVNARASNHDLAHLLKYDSVHGIFPGSVQANEEGFLLDGKQVAVTRQGPGEWKWSDRQVDIVLETTGKFNDRASCEKHLSCGARKVLVSAPAKQPDLTVVMGVNDNLYDPEKHRIVSNASCTTNCLAPVCHVLHDRFGIEHGMMTTIHSYTMSQRILDGSHKDLRRARAAAMSMIPTTTGAAKAVFEVIPELSGRLFGMAIRVPTPNVSLVDLVVRLEKPTDKKGLNETLKAAAAGELAGVTDYTELPLVSVDFIGSTFGGVVDGSCTEVIGGNMAKLIVWYDNEAGFCWQLTRLIDLVAGSLPSR